MTLSKTYENALKYIILELKWHRKLKDAYVKQENCIWASSQNICLRHYSELLRKKIKKASRANWPFLTQSDTQYI